MAKQYIGKARRLKIVMHRDWLDKHVRAQDWRCHYCGCRIFRSTAVDEKRFQSTLDHKQPKALGGPDTFENTVAACHKCNQRKGMMPYEDFVKGLRDV